MGALCETAAGPCMPVQVDIQVYIERQPHTRPRCCSCTRLLLFFMPKKKESTSEYGVWQPVGTG